MPVDVSMYPQAQPPPNLLDTIGKFQAVQGAINQNKLFPGQFQTQQLGIQQGQIANQTAQQELRQKQVSAANNYLSSAFASNPNATQADAYKAIAAGGKSGLIPPELVQTYLSQIPADPNEFKNWQGFIASQGVSPETRAGLQFGTPQMIQTGQTQVPVTVSPTQGIRQIGGAIPNQITPAELASPVDVYNPQTQARETITRAQLLGRTGGGGLPVSMTGQLPTPAPAASPGLGNGRKTNPTAGIQSTPSLGETEAATTTAANSAKMGAALTEEADQAPALKAAYSNMMTDLAGFTPGPGSDWTKVAKSFANRFTPETLKNLGIQFDPKEIASQESFNKLANQIAQAQGAQSDMHLKIAGGANPNSEMSKMTVQEVLGRLQGNQDAILAKHQAWQDYAAQNGAASYGKFSADFNKNFDPRIFQANYLSPAERQKMIADMKPAEKKDFLGKLRYATQQGWVH